MTGTKMRPFQKTITLDERAGDRRPRSVTPIDRTERVPLAAANGRVLAGDVVATADVPPFSRAAMDGYAVRAEDTTGAKPASPRTLRCIEQVFTGQMPTPARRAPGPASRSPRARRCPTARTPS